jgi:hypothetical protein
MHYPVVECETAKGTTPKVCEGKSNALKALQAFCSQAKADGIIFKESSSAERTALDREFLT